MSQARSGKLHIAIIPDGNRRFGEKNGNRLGGHLDGVRAIYRTIAWFYCQKACNVLTLYCFSEENWKRTEEEIQGIMAIARSFIGDVEKLMMNIWVKMPVPMHHIAKAVDETPHLKEAFLAKMLEYNCAAGDDGSLPTVKFCMTDTTNIPGDILDNANRINSLFGPRDKNSKHINICLSYSGRSDMVLAAAAAAKIGQITEQAIAQNLTLQGEPDLVIRTSGEKRLSNFATWQTAYSELAFIDKLWPEVTICDIEECIREYYSRQRRLGA